MVGANVLPHNVLLRNINCDKFIFENNTVLFSNPTCSIKIFICLLEGKYFLWYLNITYI